MNWPASAGDTLVRLAPPRTLMPRPDTGPRPSPSFGCAARAHADAAPVHGLELLLELGLCAARPQVADHDAGYDGAVGKLGLGGGGAREGEHRHQERRR